MNRTISDVLEYLYKEGKKDLAEIVIKELKITSPAQYLPCTLPHVTTTPNTQPYQPYPTWYTS